MSIGSTGKRNRLYKPKHLVMRRIDDFYLALNPDVPNIMVMDDVGRDFFELCDGRLTRDEIVQRILEENDGKVSKEELTEFINVMHKAKFLFLRTPAAPRRVKGTFEKLDRLYLHLTRACNLNCRHCYLEAGNSLENELTITEALGVIDEFAQLGGEQLILTGGEPLLRRKLLHEIIRHAGEVGIKVIFVETNGTLICDADIDIFGKYNVDVGVSLDGATKESHDYIRGSGNYEKTIAAIQKLSREGIKVKIGATLMKTNINEAERIIYLAKDLSADSISFNIVKGIGNATANKNLSLTSEEALSATSAMWKTAKDLGVATYLEDRFKMLEKLTRSEMCGAGTSLLAVSSNGDIYPCNMLFGLNEFKAGNIREQRLEEIWKNSKATKMFLNLSVLDIEGCQDCAVEFICANCPAEIYREHGNFGKKSSYCAFYEGTCWILIEELARKMWKD